VPGVRDLLDRFRPAGAPGPAGAAGVPADREASAAAELAPVFAALAEVVAESDRILLAADEAAERRRAEAAGQARAAVARARGEAAAIRAATAARIREDTAAELAQLTARTTAEADELRRRGATELPQLLSRVLGEVQQELASLAGPEPDRPMAVPG
jgi:hypothetical protein